MTILVQVDRPSWHALSLLGQLRLGDTIQPSRGGRHRAVAKHRRRKHPSWLSHVFSRIGAWELALTGGAR